MTNRNDITINRHCTYATWGEEAEIDRIAKAMKVMFIDKGNPARFLGAGDALRSHLDAGLIF